MDGSRTRGPLGRWAGKIKAILNRRSRLVTLPGTAVAGENRIQDEHTPAHLAVNPIPASGQRQLEAEGLRRVCHICDAPLRQAAGCVRCQHLACDQCPYSSSDHGQQDTTSKGALQRKKDSQDPGIKSPEAVDAAGRAALVAEQDREVQSEIRDDDAGQAPLIQLQVVMRVAPPSTRPALAHPTDHPTLDRAVKVVSRVYRKPRRRVRYTCETCRNVFAGGLNCTNCGHRLCENCPREPARRQSREHDPLLAEAVAQRLAAMEA